MSNMLVRTAATFTALLAIACSGDDDVLPRAEPLSVPAIVAPAAPSWLTEARRAEEDSMFADAAKRAWTFANRNYIASTGFTRPMDTYPIGTMWDLASGLAATFSAGELGLLPRTEVDDRLGRALRTLERLPLF